MRLIERNKASHALRVVGIKREDFYRNMPLPDGKKREPFYSLGLAYNPVPGDTPIGWEWGVNKIGEVRNSIKQFMKLIDRLPIERGIAEHSLFPIRPWLPRFRMKTKREKKIYAEIKALGIKRGFNGFIEAERKEFKKLFPLFAKIPYFLYGQDILFFCYKVPVVIRFHHHLDYSFESLQMDILKKIQKEAKKVGFHIKILSF